ncbi:hypothetical protein [Mariniblastus fucicola]|uniref:Uncharacterized protein n=1 Tax=Mariniblastus fucicola TaxID=980251 RepID=A0A5B9P8I2_9BACT|nr:hypothetical protein [Mariniblastus fucicola]QEG20926.1 hypothetical protein MFFC18_07770 [Mariniblastus fucicola]
MNRAHGFLKLAIATIAIVVFWCVALPRLSANPQNQAYIEFLDERGIDPSAMFYTELDCMDSILVRNESQSRR